MIVRLFLGDFLSLCVWHCVGLNFGRLADLSAGLKNESIDLPALLFDDAGNSEFVLAGDFLGVLAADEFRLFEKKD